MPELIVFTLVVVVVVVLYVLVNPKHSGNNMVKLAINDACAFALCILGAGVKYMGSHVSFDLFGIEFNWFWYTVVLYLVIATPAFLWYAKRYDVRF